MWVTLPVYSQVRRECDRNLRHVWDLPHQVPIGGRAVAVTVAGEVQCGCFRQNGHRVTSQREVILDAICRAGTQRLERSTSWQGSGMQASTDLLCTGRSTPS